MLLRLGTWRPRSLHADVALYTSKRINASPSRVSRRKMSFYPAAVCANVHGEHNHRHKRAGSSVALC